MDVAVDELAETWIQDLDAVGLPLDLDPQSPSLVDTWGLPDRERAALSRITSRPQAVWLTERTGVEQLVRQRVEGAESRDAVATLVLYRIPRRDCGSYSAPKDDLDAAGYRAWIRAVVAGLGPHRAVGVSSRTSTIRGPVTTGLST